MMIHMLKAIRVLGLFSVTSNAALFSEGQAPISNRITLNLNMVSEQLKIY